MDQADEIWYSVLLSLLPHQPPPSTLFPPSLTIASSSAVATRWAWVAFPHALLRSSPTCLRRQPHVRASHRRSWSPASYKLRSQQEVYSVVTTETASFTDDDMGEGEAAAVAELRAEFIRVLRSRRSREGESRESLSAQFSSR